MPVEIRQLQIRINVNEEDQSAGITTASTDNDNTRRGREEALVAECVEQTLHILEDKQER